MARSSLRVRCIPKAITPLLTPFPLFAGAAGRGSADGIGTSAQFDSPTDVVIDGASNLYVADAGNHTIRKMTPGGLVATLAGSPYDAGSTDGVGSVARFQIPQGVAVDQSGVVYVADTRNHSIRKITTDGAVTTLAGSAGNPGSGNGTDTSAQFNLPAGVVADSQGNIYVADSGNSTIRKNSSTGIVTTLAGTAGSTAWTDGLGSAARFSTPTGLAIDPTGNLYVGDTNNNAIRKITPSGLVTTLAGGSFGSADGMGTAAQFYFPNHLSIEASGNLYVADKSNSMIRKITPAGLVTTLAGSPGSFGTGSVDGAVSISRFYYPYGVTSDSAGNIYVADTSNHTIRKISQGMTSTFAGIAVTSGSADGAGITARFLTPDAIAVDSAGNVYVADTGNHTIRKATPAGVVTTIAGLAGSPGSTDGTGSAARFSRPEGVAVDSAGNLYIADTDNQTIRKITPTGVVTTLAGPAGSFGKSDGAGNTARFWGPTGIAVDGAGSLYVTDSNNNTVRKITSTGGVTTLAGLANNLGSTDGTGTVARILVAPRHRSGREWYYLRRRHK